MSAERPVQDRIRRQIYAAYRDALPEGRKPVIKGSATRSIDALVDIINIEGFDVDVTVTVRKADDVLCD